MGFWITFGILFLLAVLPLGVRVRYDAEGPLVKVVLGPVKLTVFPRPKKETKPKKEKKQRQPSKPAVQEAHLPKPEAKQDVQEADLPQPEKKQEGKEKDLPKPPQAPPEPKPEKKGGSLTDFLPFVKLAVDFLGDLRRKLRLDDLYLRLILASDDPCDLAVNYGRTWTAVGNFLPVLEQWFVIKKRDVEVECDFTASETKVIARLEITITLGRLISLAAVYACRGLKEFIVFRNKRKGGADK